MFEFLKKLKPKAGSDEISKTRDGIELDALRAAHEAATAERVDRLLAGAEDAEILAIETRIEAARIAVDRAEVVIADLDRRYAEAAEAERMRAEQAKFDAIVEKIESARAEWDAEYATHATALAKLCEKMKAADFSYNDTLRHVMMGMYVCDTSRWKDNYDRSWAAVTLPAVEGFPGWGSYYDTVAENKAYHASMQS
ncbi:hypothetical protein ASG43_08900 [Aureimonas sp. Leaf454]|uniref:hypothetical protein n=1 Tax=Aureimonas sp. Leaf454 TaxID=1736381 RepID=UPI0006F9B599|nr:hypothetical protein [Aureimonas sp. Leaf454]KQT48941.1 hypothetical protein ASG43_08900 [Aureimonas sp. Leaf454]